MRAFSNLLSLLFLLFVVGCLGDVPEFVPKIVPPADADGDGFDADEDCDDSDNTVYPGATELCDGKDNDCDGATDEDDAIDAATWYRDADGDGYGDDGQTTQACEASDGFVYHGGDCDDSDNHTYPGASERCDGVDNNCDGDVDEELTEFWYYDADSDGFGDAEVSIESCDPDDHWVADNADCDDTDPDVNPAADERCDAVDNDCDDLTDEDDAIDAATWYRDADMDGYGDVADSSVSCSQPSGYVEQGGDCDDSDPAFNPSASETDCTDPNDYNCDGSTGYADADTDGFAACEDCNDADADVNPGADELCDAVDNDCDGTTDEDDAIDAAIWYRDADMDGYGDIASTTTACAAPSGFADNDTDCDDTDAAINSGATEVCDSADTDEDCNGFADDDDSGTDWSTKSYWYEDRDRDGYGDPRLYLVYCDMGDPDFVTNGLDCDDGNEHISPVGIEHCDGIDNDCDGLIDDDDPDVDASMGGSTFYLDADLDGYGDVSDSVQACDEPSGYVEDATDCDDTDPDVNPGATEICGTGVDEDCDDLLDFADVTSDLVCNGQASGLNLFNQSTYSAEDPNGTASNGEASERHSGSTSDFRGNTPVATCYGDMMYLTGTDWAAVSPVVGDCLFYWQTDPDGNNVVSSWHTEVATFAAVDEVSEGNTVTCSFWAAALDADMSLYVRLTEDGDAGNIWYPSTGYYDEVPVLKTSWVMYSFEATAMSGDYISFDICAGDQVSDVVFDGFVCQVH